MDISARVLREVEFNSSLRGYNTDEVDEFLEQVADGVDRLQAEAKAAAERAEHADRTVHDPAALDDADSIRRTLVLAQRTADLAIREAQEEAGQILDRARGEAQTLVGDAHNSAERITTEAERRLQEDVTRLSSSRDALRTEVDTLVSLLGTERERLTETLGAALRYVERSLSPSASLMSLQTSDASPDLAGTDGVSGSEHGSDADGEPAGLADTAAVPVGAYTVVALPEAETPQAESASAEDTPRDGRHPEGDDGGVDPGEIDDLEAAIAEDAAAAAPEHGPPETEADQYDWDSVIRGQADPPFGDEPSRVERANLTALPSIDEPSQDTSALQTRARGTDWDA